ncbi:MAG: FAD-binding oxidoreductase [Candidatus Hydrogenedentes bacterium]|nr:FAD-binding oxidoreductase [Candidatus Hydrogenedentota bacterium]
MNLEGPGAGVYTHLLPFILTGQSKGTGVVGVPSTEQRLSGWGRLNPELCSVHRPEKHRTVREAVEQAGGTLLARGLGRSYGDAAVNGGGGVVDMTRLNRLLAFDAESGVVECEAGVSLADLVAAFLPRGWFLPVTPGTKFVTVGGAIAHDIHGKNHHRDGTFGQFVREFKLLIANGETISCSRKENQDVFWATIGGAGLTGIILSASVRLQPVESAYYLVDYRRAKNLEDALRIFAETDEKYQYSVAWIDCLARGGSLGRSVLMLGNSAPVSALPAHLRNNPLCPREKRKTNVPVDMPELLLNPLSMKIYNTLFHARNPERDGAVVDFDTYYYPLDSVHNWNRLYGKRGFAQFQATVPPEGVAALVQILERISATKSGFLGVLKAMGEQNEGLLSHPIKGYTLTLDIPNHGKLGPFLHGLDEILLAHGGRIYLAKDAVSRPETLEAMYPRLKQFRAVKAKVDPERRFDSSQARRLGITGD